MTRILSHSQGQFLLKLARLTLAQEMGEAEAPPIPNDPDFFTKAASFVSLKIDGKLRGCIGNLEPVGALWQGVCDNTLNAALHDHRFSPICLNELQNVQIDIAILTRSKPLIYKNREDLLTKLRPGIDGVVLQYGRHRATFLPQVWEQLPSPSLFLDHLCQKAGLPGDSWWKKTLEIKTYQVQSFTEEQQ